MLKSKLRLRQIFGPILILSPMIILITLPASIFSGREEDVFLMRVLMSIAVLALLGYVYYKMFKQAPRIVIDEANITYSSPLGTQVYAVKDIKKIKYTGVSIDRGIIKNYEEAATIIYKDGSSSYIRDDYYSNVHELKQHLQALRGEHIHQCTTKHYEPDTSNAKYYKGSMFLSFRFLLSLLPLYLALHVFIDNIEKGDIVLYIVSAVLFTGFLLFSTVFYYVGVSDRYLIIKNHQLFWVRRRFLLSDVREVVVEYFLAARGPYAPRAIRIITKDFKYRRYNAATLYDKQWRQLQSELQAKGIHFRHQARTE